jgi:hypothetical protein
MWSIEVSEDASEEEVIQAVLEELDFDYIRECIAQLNDVIEKYGPLTEVQEAAEGADSSPFAKTYHEKRGWICDDLASIDPLKVWTLSDDPVNGYSYLMNGYYFNEVEPGRHPIRTWYIADKSFEKVDDKVFTINTEFRIWHEITDEEESDDTFYIIDIWELVGSDDLSDEAIAGALSDLYYF